MNLYCDICDTARNSKRLLMKNCWNWILWPKSEFISARDYYIVMCALTANSDSHCPEGIVRNSNQPIKIINQPFMI